MNAIYQMDEIRKRHEERETARKEMMETMATLAVHAVIEIEKERPTLSDEDVMIVAQITYNQARSKMPNEFYRYGQPIMNRPHKEIMQTIGYRALELLLDIR
jgi:hypothetical protein